MYADSERWTGLNVGHRHDDRYNTLRDCVSLFTMILRQYLQTPDKSEDVALI